ncbi:hypothetical protein [Vogesella urethralis]|uniref:hypothetical protein n=1 Tax=Vogesella urethralis TaxID=2592656 RepID=UPI001184A870|nr:hypothetical protein [Vogesella urethralis]
MGFFSSAASWVSSKVSSVASAVKNVASKAYDEVKEVAGEAMGWMAEKAEKFVDDVKKTWAVVKPYVEALRVGIRMAAKAVPIPWLKSALIALDVGLGALTAFENSPVAKKVEQAIRWAAELARKWQQRGKETEQEQEGILGEAALQEARRHQETFRFAERESLSPEARHNIELAAAINDYEIAKADLARVLAGEPADFEHYLRLRATQKLLVMADKQFRAASSLDDLSVDDLFLVRIASDLIKPNPELNEVAAERLDRLLAERYGKALQPFVFEEMVAAWVKRADVLASQWQIDNKNYAKEVMLLKRLEVAKRIQEELAPDEAQALNDLAVSVPVAKQKLDELATKEHDIRRYVGAAEGFLQLMEKSREQILSEDREYLIEEGGDVGKILIRCAEQDVPFIALTGDEQALVRAYANVFSEESARRMKDILEVAV